MAWITNGEVAWEIPPGRIAHFFRLKAYLPPDSWAGWEIVEGLSTPYQHWTRGKCGEVRREVESAS